MSNILICGMEMPTGSAERCIVIRGDGTIRTFTGALIDYATAISVPPHGKLVDVADVKELFEKHFGDDQIAFQLIDSVPVIIPPKSKEQQDQEDLVERLNREGIAP